MKIGILTFHWAHNYGAILQCYALQEYLKECGHDVFIIDYLPSHMFNVYEWFSWKRFMRFNILASIQEIFRLRKRKVRYNKFQSFIKEHFRLFSIDRINDFNNLNLIIVGSDQVWNTKLTNGFDFFYWGKFKSYVKTPLISYAASMEERTERTVKEQIKDMLKNFDGISVREDELKQYLLPLSSLPISTVVDPTLLIKKETWDKVVIKPQYNKPYLLLYQVRKSDKTIKIAKKIAKERKLQLLILSANSGIYSSMKCQSASPFEFLGWFKHASFVVCASFHGTVFSILFKRQFYSIRLNDGKDSRVENIINHLGLQNRFISQYKSSYIDIDYDNTFCKLENFVKDSKSFINLYTN